LDTNRLSHSGRGRPAPTVGDALRRATRRLAAAKLHYGQGTERPVDDAAALLAHALRLRRPLADRDLPKAPSAAAAARFEALLRRRIRERVPAVYLTRRAWFAGLPMHVDERVLVPRSPIAELAEARFSPWVDPARVRRVLDVGTGSGCIAIACAVAFPRARVDAVDISADALAVARLNRRLNGVQRRLRLLESDYFAALGDARYDIIVSNPPYVGTAEYRGLPPEYGHEPSGALESGRAGMDAVRVLLREAPRHLNPGGVLVVEVGNTEARVRREYPRLPFLWLEFTRGGGGVFLLTAEQLRLAGRQGR
jgi:ribosomal protein L3 glutamine methyltransferase